MPSDQLNRVLQAIDAANSADPNTEEWQGQSYPKELLYGQRMSARLQAFAPDADEVAQIAARGQHIRRWEVPRENYPASRPGYLQWRSFLYQFHADAVGVLMAEAGYADEPIARVKTILSKRGIKSDPDVQRNEDVACLVFLEYYFAAFAAKQPAEKLPDIVRKTWTKMSPAAQAAALTLEFPESVRPVLAAALGAA